MALKINIGDSWKDMSAMKINIADTWKPVTAGYINIGDSWKRFFYSGFTITSNTRLYYKLDNNANDSSGNGYNGIASNVTYTTGLNSTSTNSGIFLSGSTSTITGTSNTEFGFTGDFTVSCWWKPTSGYANGTYHGLVSRRKSDDTAGWSLSDYYGGGKHYLIFATAGGGNYYDCWAADGNNTTINDNSVYNVMIVRSGVNMSIYLNGVVEVSQNKASALNTSFAGNLFVGRTRQSAGEQLNGQIDDVIIENRAWSANEILTYYKGNI